MDKCMGQPQLFKEVNYNIINRLIAEKGPVSKPQLAQLTGLSLPTVNKIVYCLEDMGRIREAGTTTGLGRKAVLYVTNEEQGNILTITLSGQSMTCCVVSLTGKIIHRFGAELDVSNGSSALGSLCAAIDRLLENSEAKAVAVCVGLPGWVDMDGTVVQTPVFTAWNGVNLQEQLQKNCPAPVYIQSNVRFAAVGYYAGTLKKDCKNMVYIHLGKEMSSSAILNKKLYTGATCFAGSCGYMVTDLEKIAPQPEKEGSFERRMVQVIEGLNTEQEKESLLLLRRELIIGLTTVIINYIAMLNPEVVVLGGNAVGKGYLSLITDLVGRYVPKQVMPSIQLDSNAMSGIQGMVSWYKAKINTGYPMDDVI